MNKTSRRNFGKQITGALAALPVVTLAGSENVSADTKQQPSARALQEIRTSHNTPPDVVISEGSLIIESDDELEDVGSNVYKPKVNPTGEPDITHIRILVDNGDKVYEDLEAKGSSVVVGWQDNAGSPKKALDILNMGGAFTIKSDKSLTPKTVANKHRKTKLVHSDGDRFRIAYVAVTNPSGFTTTFSAFKIRICGISRPDMAPLNRSGRLSALNSARTAKSRA